uniref:Aluminum-activated malate transporter 10 n=1 Tax=Aegilops tauschii TaxID=37682 RepID=M8C5S9_AEGTA
MEMAPATRDGKNGGVPEWRVTVPEGASVTVEHESCRAARAWAWMVSCVVVLGDKVSGFAKRIWKIGADDPRRAVHGLKVGLALALVSVFYYTRPLYDGVGGAAMWAIMTVVVIFEYTVGGCVYKGFNRAAATVSAGAIALGVHWIAANAGHEFEPFIRSGSVFLLASMATFSRFIPTVKARFDYGVTIFILTYSLVAVSGYRVEALLAMAQQRVCTIGIGVFMCLSVCVLICPVWAGQELHRLTVRNMGKLAGAVEACVEALSGCVRSEIQAPEHVKRHLADGCTTVAARCARVLGEAESSVSAMTTSWSLEFAVADMNTAAQELQSDLRELPSKLAEESPATVIDAVQLFTVTSLLIEVSTRVEGVVDAVDTLASLAGFRSADAKPEASETETKVINPDSDEEAH